MPDVILESVRKTFGDVVAVDSIDLRIADGEMVTLLGPSGCGKTTTLRMIAGLEVPNEGRIGIGEMAVYDRAASLNIAPELRNLGMVFQSYAIWPHMTVAENVAYPLRMRRIARSESRRLVDAVLSQVGLGGLGDTPATNLSGGQQQRVALARALVFEPQVLLLDEPLSNLDAKLREHMRFELRIMQRRLGVTALYVTHDQEEALTLSDRVVVMSEGRIEQMGTPTEIYERPATRFVAEFIGKANFLDVSGIAPAADGGVEIPLETRQGRAVIRLAGDHVRAREGAANGSGSLFIRPEKIRIEAGGGTPREEEARIPGEVLGRAYLGDHAEYLVGIRDGVDLRVPAPVENDWPEGTAVELAVNRKDIFLYT